MCHACDQQLVYQEKECRAQINLTLFKAHNSTFDVYNVPVAPMFTWVKSATGHFVVKPLSGAKCGAKNPRIHTYLNSY